MFSHETKVYNTFTSKIATWLQCGHNVIADATHLNEASRRKLINRLLNKHNLACKDYDIVFIVMATNIDTCITRDALREGRAHVTAQVIRRFFSNFTFPSKEEFENVIGVWKIYE